MKVGVDLSAIGFRSRAPGTAVHVENQVRALLAMNVNWEWVLVATPRALQEAPFFKSFNPILAEDGPLSYHVYCRLGRLWKKAECSLGLATAFFAPLNGPPVVTNYFDANAYHPVRDHSGLRHQVKSLILRTLTSLSCRRSRALFILSNYGRSRMIEAHPASAAKWVVAPCGCPPVPSPSRNPEWASRLNGRPFILYAGAFSHNKNQRRLIEAWDKLRRRREDTPALVLVGPAPADFLYDIIEPALARTYRPDEIVLPGFLPEEEVGWAYRHAHAYFQPSFAEGFGMPVVQAMSCGIPVACSNSTSLPEVAGDAALLFEPAEVESIVTAMERLVFDEAVRTRLVSAGLERVKAFSWERHAAIVAGRIREELTSLC